MSIQLAVKEEQIRRDLVDFMIQRMVVGVPTNQIADELTDAGCGDSNQFVGEIFNQFTEASRNLKAEQHKKLKLYVKNNPKSIGVKLNGIKSETEKGLPSGDSIDVFFENKQHWIGVEVKSEISDELDILRGLYQCVKYHAVMESYLSVLNLQRDVKVVLALGCELPGSLVSVRNTLGVEVVENING